MGQTSTLQLLQVIHEIQSQYLEDAPPREVFDNLLKHVLDLTGSEYGFVGEVQHLAGDTPYLKTRAITNIAWDDASRRFYDQNAPAGLEFFNLNSLFGAVLTSGEAVVSNDPVNDPRRTGLPPGHPALRCFLGLPLYTDGKMIGMLGMANREGGYDEALAEDLAPLLTTCSQILRGYRHARDRRDAEAALRRSERRFRRLLESNILGIIVVDEEFSVLEANQKFLDLVGYSRQDLPLAAARITPEQWLSLDLHALREATESEGAPPWGKEYLHRHGHRVPVLIGLASLDEEQSQAICFVVDQTGQRQAERDRESLQEKMLQSQKLESLGLLAGGIAHDFNNLLVGILGNADIAMMVVSDPKAREFLNNITESGQRAADLCQQMLAYSGKGREKNDSLDLSEEVKEISKLLAVSVCKRTPVRYDLDPALPRIEGDSTQIRQVMMNLIINASEAVESERGLVHVRTGTRFCGRAMLNEMYFDQDLQEGHYVFLEVEDNGCGMNGETLARIYDPFFTTKDTGHGLGLAAVLGIVRSHQGLIKIESQEGEGTVFCVYLPICHSPENQHFHETAEIDLRALSAGVILLVDDEQSVLDVGRNILEGAGYQVRTASTSTEALAICQELGSLAALMLDQSVRGLSEKGTEDQDFIGWTIERKVPIIVSSGFAESDVRTALANARTPLAGFVQKPYRSRTLLKQLRRVLQG